MNQPVSFYHHPERGAASLKFLITVLLLAVGVYAAVQYVPVAMRAKIFEDTMQTKINQAAAMNRPVEWVSEQLRADLEENNFPREAIVNVRREDRRLEANVQFTQPVALPGYLYNYKFNHSVKSGTFLAAN